MTKRRFYSLIFVLILLFIFMMIYKDIGSSISRELYDYYINNFYEHTKSENAVTAIYLNYRVFDTLFETLTLLISVVGVIYFSRHTLVKMNDGDENNE